jgi:NADH-quinone oxidoreductase subunit B
MGIGLNQSLGDNIITARIDDVLNWARENSLWLYTFGLACCAIEMIQCAGPRSDLERFGMAPRATPRQADLMIVAGTVTYKMAIRAKLLYEQMAEPRYVIAMGSCANCGGLFTPAYSVLKGIDKVIPVDVYVPGCPPRPEALVDGIFKLREKVRREKFMRKPTTPVATHIEGSDEITMFTMEEFPRQEIIKLPQGDKVSG